jgi:uncharacterized membrane protein HdeD (DUF308 family)
MGKLARLVALVVGIALILIGVPLFLTPFPGGAATIVIGLLLVVSSNSRAQRFLRRQRDNHPKLDERLNHVEEHMPERARGPLEKTHPDRR